MPASIQFGFGDEAMWRKIWLFTRSCFHAEFLEFQSYSSNRNHFDIDSKQNSFWQNSSDSYGEVFRNDGKFLFLFWWKSEEHKVTSSWSQKVEISILGLLRTVFRQKCEEHEMTSGWSQKGLNFNLRVIENRLQSIHFICMNNDFVSHERALPTDPDCLPLIRKGLIKHVT